MNRVLGVLLQASLLVGCAAHVSPPQTAGSFGLTAPGEDPIPFTPTGLWSELDNVECIAFSNDGRRLCYGGYTADDLFRRIYVSTYAEGQWQTPTALPGQPGGKHWGFPTYAADGGYDIYFTEGMPLTQKVARLHAGGWRIEDLPHPPNAKVEWGIVHAADGSAYFGGPTADQEHDLYVAHRHARGYKTAERLHETLNSSANETRPYVSPDGDILIFESTRAGGRPDLYVSFALDDGDGTKWTAPVPLGSAINTDALEDGPWISPDGEQFFFRRWTVTDDGNGVSRVYWVDMSVVRKLDPRPND